MKDVNIEQLIEHQLVDLNKNLDFIKLSVEFSQNSIVVIENFFSEEINDLLRVICNSCLGTEGYLRDLLMKSTDSTPRIYKSCGYKSVKDKAPIIDYIHSSILFKEIVRGITCLNPETPAFSPERYIINQQCGVGHTHGWHWDDYSIALGLCIDGAEEDSGGVLEFVPNTQWNKENPNIKYIVETNKVERIKVKSGSFYINRADTTLHRITPLERGNSVRTMIVFSYQTEADTNKKLVFETMEELYPEDCAVE